MMLVRKKLRGPTRHGSLFQRSMEAPPVAVT